MAAPLSARDKLLSRMTANAEQMMEAYPRADILLRAAMQEAMPWAMALGTRGRTPRLDQLERLGTQILAILLASHPDPAGAPDPLDPPRGQAKIINFGR